MLRSTALVQTDIASRYLQQLCKHFAHKLPTSFTPDTGRIDFPGGPCLLGADAATLTLTVESDTTEGLDQLEDVVARHLVRFAFREPPVVAWTRPPASAA